ncbi:putative intraflagellar transport protein [Toxoplasma gondii RUB]|uniref:Putative intraflagellar transport protein n=1 Tax=Toxoplasma gondii RUB TaxID=935652 RepID=A0A086M0W4_TOXGO|nr:putative intraflagellar transport protein [Toxoplasma gondii RUB]
MAAALAADRVVHLFDARGSKVDRFDTRPADKAATNAHSVTALALSPDASRVAVAQSDNMVVVYHLGLAKTDKKVVYRKFPTTAPVASVLWPSDVAATFFYGQIDGRVRVAHVDLNKAGTLFDRKSPLICFDCERSGTLLATGHADGSIQLCSLNASTSRATTREVYRFPVSVTAISCTAACVAAAAQTTEIALINREGNLLQLIDFRSMSPFSKEISSLAFHPSGSCLAVAAREHVHIFGPIPAGSAEHLSPKRFEVVYSSKVPSF